MANCVHDKFTRVEEFALTHVAACIRCGHRIYGLEALDTLARQAEAAMETPYKRDQEDVDPRDVEPEAQRSWLEFQVFAAIHSLKEYDRNHYLVRVIEAAITPNYPGENLPAFLRRQAD